MPLIEQFQIIDRIMYENRQKNQMQFGSAIYLFFLSFFWFSTVPAVSCGALFRKSEVCRAQ